MLSAKPYGRLHGNPVASYLWCNVMLASAPPTASQ